MDGRRKNKFAIPKQRAKRRVNSKTNTTAHPETIPAAHSTVPVFTMDNVYCFAQDDANKNRLTPWKYFVDRSQDVAVFFQIELQPCMRDLPQMSKAVRVEKENASSRRVKGTIFLGERRMSDDLVKFVLGRPLLESEADLELLLQHVDRFPLARV